MTKKSYRQAINEALRQEMRRDPTVILYGEDVANFGGIFRITSGLKEEFGEERLLDVIEDNWQKSSGEICDAILARIRSFLGSQWPQDDQTLMVARLQPISLDLSSLRSQTESVMSLEKLDFVVKP